jgi:hypothetical protein
MSFQKKGSVSRALGDLEELVGEFTCLMYLSSAPIAGPEAPQSGK